MITHIVCTSCGGRVGFHMEGCSTQKNSVVACPRDQPQASLLNPTSLTDTYHEPCADEVEVIVAADAGTEKEVDHSVVDVYRKVSD